MALEKRVNELEDTVEFVINGVKPSVDDLADIVEEHDIEHAVTDSRLNDLEDKVEFLLGVVRSIGVAVDGVEDLDN